MTSKRSRNLSSRELLRERSPSTFSLSGCSTDGSSTDFEDCIQNLELGQWKSLFSMDPQELEKLDLSMNVIHWTAFLVSGIAPDVGGATIQEKRSLLWMTFLEQNLFLTLPICLHCLTDILLLCRTREEQLNLQVSVFSSPATVLRQSGTPTVRCIVCNLWMPYLPDSQRSITFLQDLISSPSKDLSISGFGMKPMDAKSLHALKLLHQMDCKSIPEYKE